MNDKSMKYLLAMVALCAMAFLYSSPAIADCAADVQVSKAEVAEFQREIPQTQEDKNRGNIAAWNSLLPRTEEAQHGTHLCTVDSDCGTDHKCCSGHCRQVDTCGE